MLTRILEKLDTHNARMKRESEAREAEAQARRERQRRAEASGRPTGLACPVCRSELGDGETVVAFGKCERDPSEWQSQQQVLCPNCGFEGWRVIYTPDVPNP